MARQFIVTLMNLGGIFEHKVNCADENHARIICEGLFGGHRVIDVKEVKYA